MGVQGTPSGVNSTRFSRWKEVASPVPEPCARLPQWIHTQPRAPLSPGLFPSASVRDGVEAAGEPQVGTVGKERVRFGAVDLSGSLRSES